MEGEEEEISLIDLFGVVWRRRAVILVITALAAAGSVGVSVVSLLLPPEESFMANIYTPEALMLINDSRSGGGSLSSALSSSGLGSLASLAGLNLGSGGQKYSDLAQYLITTNTFLDAVTERFGLIERYKIKRDKSPRAGSRKALKKLLTAEYDSESGVLSIGFSDRDAEFAREVVNYSVEYLGEWFKELGLDKDVLQKANIEQNIENTFNDIRELEEESRRLERDAAAGGISSIMLESRRLQLELTAKQEVYRQLRVQLELVNVSLASESPIFQILEKAEAPDQKSGPSRGLICMIATGGGFFLGIFLVFALNAAENIRKDPEAMEKLRGSGEGRRRVIEG